ncbi:MAG: zinc-binding dehydrogenase [Alphaproteobacteria bacterium]|nr:zinc-binding dehydrogenase [Alphaproteobacteria bacterium]
MVEVHRSTIIDAPIEAVWNVIRDFNGHDRWHPAVATSAIEAGEPPDLIGAVRDFRLADGSRIREQLLSLSDKDHSFQYCILEAPLPLMGYVAEVRLKPVTDGARTFWQWRSTFHPPAARRAELVSLVGEGIYQAGFDAIRQMLRGRAPKPESTPPPASSPARPSAGAGTNAHAVVIEGYGGPEMLRFKPVSVPPPGAGEVRLRQTAIGVNYIDVYCRTGYFRLVPPGGIPGMEAAGIVDSVGSGVTGFRPGDRVGYACAPPGAYTDLRVMVSDLLVHLPNDLGDEAAASVLLKGIAASFLLHDVYAVKSGDVVVVHAAAGGVGSLLCQWAAALGAHVIGTVSTDDKAARARAAGARDVIVYTRENFTERVLALTDGRGADVVYDAVGHDTFQGSLDCLKIRGSLVSFGQASGDIGAHDIGGLASKSITLSRPNYGHFTSTRDDVERQTARLFAALRDGLITAPRPATYPLADAARAHADLESRRTSGSLVLIP